MARHDARCVGTVAADSAALIWDASAPFFMFDRPFLVTPRWTLFCWRECYLADTSGLTSSNVSDGTRAPTHQHLHETCRSHLERGELISLDMEVAESKHNIT